MIHRKFIKNIPKLKLHHYENKKAHKNLCSNGKYVVLLYCCQSRSDEYHNQRIIDEEFLRNTRTLFPNQVRVQGTKHYGSEGAIYSFGYVANYKKLDETQISFSKYTTKKKNNDSQKNTLTNYEIEDVIFSYLSKNIEMLCKKIPNLKTVLSPDVSKLQLHFDLSDKEQLCSSKKMFKYGLLNGHMCVNARTKVAHTECDTSYTMISIPKQYDLNFKRLEPCFNFILNDDSIIVIPMSEHISFIYSGYMLCHHQVLNYDMKKDTTFFNFATYGNKRLFDNMMKSFKRTLNI